MKRIHLLFAINKLKEIIADHSEYELEMLSQAISTPHTALKDYFKTLSANMAFVLYHLNSISKGFDEYDDQLSLKLK